MPNYIGEAVAFLESHPDYVMGYPQAKLLDGNDQELEHADSDIDTSGLNVKQRMEKTAANLFLFLCAAAYHGHIYFIQKLGMLRRESRQETLEMIKKRNINSGNYRETGSRFFNSWSIMTMEHVMFIYFNKNY